ncbi:YozE family protein [Desulfococcaceae bacterium HSG8]|nr:YozE family protein [Desulfococcaceae bacterium HSG8]
MNKNEPKHEGEWRHIRPSGFSRWLFKQNNESSPIGDLANDAIVDAKWPRKAKKFIEFRLYLVEEAGACQGALDALTEAWTARYHQQPPFPDDYIEDHCEEFYAGECDVLKYGDSYHKSPTGKTYIYVIFEPETDSTPPYVRYVGQTKDPSKRLKQHITCPGSIKKVIWTGELLKKGVYPCMGIVDIVENKNVSLMEETYILAFLGIERRVNQPIDDILFNISLMQDYIKLLEEEFVHIEDNVNVNF